MTSELREITGLIANVLPIMAALAVFLKPVREGIGKWLSKHLTQDVRVEMKDGFARVNSTLEAQKAALVVQERVQSRRHRGNQVILKSLRKGHKEIADELTKANHRMDDHLIDHGKD